MTDAERIERLTTALNIIHTWARVDGALVPEHVRDLIQRTRQETALAHGRPTN